MKNLLLVIVLCRALSHAWPILPSTEQAIQMEIQLAEKVRSNTLDEIRRGRVGVPDVLEYSFRPEFAKWEDEVVTYKILKYTQKMPRADVDEIFKQAFELWSNVTCLTFMQSWNASDIQIVFGAGFHTDADDDCPFDEENGVLGHAYSTSEGGNKAYIHFDDDEKWTKDFSGINLYLTVVHEVGHLLGLDHSANEQAIMYTYYEAKNTTNFKLHQDDIDGIQALHGKPGNCSHRPHHPAPPRKILSEEESPRICDLNITFDAVTTFKGELFYFYDGFVFHSYLLQNDPVKRDFIVGYIGDFWPILKCGINAAYEVEDKGILYVFKELRYRTVSGNLKNLSSSQYLYTLGLPQNITRIDAAVYDQETKKTLFFTGDEYWRYDEETRSTEKGYPRKIEADFPEIGSRVNAAFQYNGHLYLISGPNQYEFDRTTYRLIDMKKTLTWIGCSE